MLFLPVSASAGVSTYKISLFILAKTYKISLFCPPEGCGKLFFETLFFGVSGYFINFALSGSRQFSIRSVYSALVLGI